MTDDRGASAANDVEVTVFPDPRFDRFPLGVWLKLDGSNHIAEWKSVGMNLYVGLYPARPRPTWRTSPGEECQVICSRNQAALASPYLDVVLGWSQVDEPDNAQASPAGTGYGPPILPSVIQSRYTALKAADPGRPVYLNLGMGVAWDGWWGRGTRTSHPEDYPEYVRGGDIVSFDVSSPSRAESGASWSPIKDELRRVPRGSTGWSPGRGAKAVWNFVECTDIRGQGKPTPPR